MKKGTELQAPQEHLCSDVGVGAGTTARRILVTGATGYVGGRLVPVLIAAGYHVRCLVRDPARLQGRGWIEDVDIIRGDVLKSETLIGAFEGIDTAFYLVHSMAGGQGFQTRDLDAARNFCHAAKHAGCSRIVYLGGLAPDPEGKEASTHLKSRQETGHALREANVPVLEFRAGVIVGSGSLSFEIIRYLTERVPVLVTPKWVHTKTQPIGIREVLAYLKAAVELDLHDHTIVEIGGSDVLSYGEMMMEYATIRGLKRYRLSVPVLTPRLSSYWVDLVTPIPASIARPLIDGLKNEVRVRSANAARLFPEIKPAPYAVSVNRALDRLHARTVETSWSDALASSQVDHRSVILRTDQGMIVELRKRTISAPASKVYAVFTGIGGKRGWYFWQWAWVIRGFIDRIAGGVGLRRGRRSPDDLRIGEALDFWRVEILETDKRLRLFSEMKVPGNAWLQFETRDLSDGQSELVQTAYFAPKGLWGLAYWYLLYPVHAIIFSGMIRNIGKRAEGRN